MEPIDDGTVESMIEADEADWKERAPYIADYYTERELRLILNCIEYRDGDPAGLPGHNLMLLIAKLVEGSLGWHTERIYELLEMKKADG